MRLLDTWTGQFVEKDPRDPKTKYAVLSHTWDSEGEQSYQELKDIQKRYYESVPPQHPQYPLRDSELLSAAHDQDVSSPIPSSPHNLSLSILYPIQPAFHPIPSSTKGIVSQTPSLQQKVYSPSPFPLQPSYNTPMTISVQIPDHSLNAKPEHIAMPVRPIWDDVKLSPKIREACKVARERGYRYMWIDSCCIDKTSSSELSEAINSMYYWYARSEMCYAFLADVPEAEDARRKGSHFRRSRWFTRGWTLQELIAPVHVVFLSKEWTVVGSKSTLADVVIEVTDIDYDALLGLHPPAAFSVAKRFSWASRRQTTRAEDRAYSLLGIFDINMPTLYGEGDRAFRRLQEEIMRRIPDQSLFAWTHFSFDSLPRLATTRRWEKYVCSDHFPGDLQNDSPQLHGSLLAPSLDAFVHCGRIRALYHYEVIRQLTQLRAVSASDPQTVTDYDYNFTPHGIRTQLPVIRLANYLPPGVDLLCPRTIPLSRWYLVILGCEHEDLPGFLLGRVFHTLSSGSDVEFLECGSVSVYSNGQTNPQLVADLFPLAPAILRNFFFLKTMYMDHYPGKANGEFELEVARRQPHEMFVLTLSSRSCDAFEEQGYMAVERGPNAARPDTHLFTFSNRAHSIAFECQHTLGEYQYPDKQRLTIQGRITLSGPLFDDATQNLCQVDDPSIVTWTDFLPWSRNIGDETVALRIARNREMTMQFGIAFVTKDHYSLEVAVSVHSTATTSPDGGLLPSSYLLQSCRTGLKMVKEIPAWLLIFVGAPTMAATESMDGGPEVGGAAAVRQGMPGELLCDDQSDLLDSQDAVHENAGNPPSP